MKPVKRSGTQTLMQVSTNTLNFTGKLMLSGERLPLSGAQKHREFQFQKRCRQAYF